MKSQLMIVIADAASARFHSVVRGNAPELFAELDHAAGRLQSKELVSDRPGQMRSDNSGRPQSLAQRTSPAEIEREKFARHLAQTINNAFELNQNSNGNGNGNGRFAELALVMPPKLLGLVRAQLSAKAQGAIVGEIARRLSDRSIDEVYREIEAVRRPAALA